MKLIPVASYLYERVIQELSENKCAISLDGKMKLEPIYSFEQRDFILENLIKFLKKERVEIQKQIS